MIHKYLKKFVFKTIFIIGYLVSKSAYLQNLIAKILFKLFTRRVALGIDALSRIMPDDNIDCKIKIIDNVFKNYVKDFSSNIVSCQITDNAKLDITDSGLDDIKNLIAQGKNVLLFSGHFVKFQEIGAYIRNDIGKENTGAFYKKIKPTILNEYILKLRGFEKHYSVGKENIMIFQKDLKKSARATFILFDQYHKQGVTFDFFNAKIKLSTSLQRLAIKQKTYIYYIDISQIKSKTHVDFINIFNPEKDNLDEVEVTQKLIQNLEKTILRSPSTWLALMHNILIQNKEYEKID